MIITKIEFNEKYGLFKLSTEKGEFFYFSIIKARELFGKSYQVFDLNLTSVVDLAVKSGILSVESAPEVQDLTNKGFAREGIPENPLIQQFPEYWNFLLQTRLDSGDSGLI